MINNAIQVKVFNIFWEPGSWKTMLFAFISYFYYKQGGKVYSNFEILLKGKKINIKIDKVSDIKKIKKENKKWLLILDEAGMLLNSRESMQNVADKGEILELAFISRKKNIDIGLGAQLDYSIDKYFRDLGKYNFYMQSMRRTREDLIFSYDIYTRGGRDKGYLIGNKEIRTLRAIELLNIEYNTLEDSKVVNEKKINREEKKKKKENEVKVIKKIEIWEI